MQKKTCPLGRFFFAYFFKSTGFVGIFSHFFENPKQDHKTRDFLGKKSFDWRVFRHFFTHYLSILKSLSINKNFLEIFSKILAWINLLATFN